MGIDAADRAGKARIRGILFDKDGTLIDFHATWLPILKEAALMTARGEPDRVPDLMASVGYDAGSGRVLSGSVIAAGDTRDLAEVWSVQATGWRVDDLVIRLDALFTARGAANSAPVTDLVRLFTELRGRGLKLGIATNDTAASALATIERFGLAVHLDFHCGYDSGHGSKPAPGMVHAFCAATGLTPSEVAVVGDNRHDFDMGRAGGAGLAVGVLTGTSSRADLEPHTDVVIDSVVDLPALLERLG